MASKNLFQEVATPSNPQLLEQIGVNAAKVSSLCDKVKVELATLGAEPEICTIFNDLCEAIRCINDSQTRLAESQRVAAPTSLSTIQAPPKRVKQVTGTINHAPVLVDISRPHPEATESAEDTELSKFKEAVKDAKRSTLVFNLNMGTVP